MTGLGLVLIVLGIGAVIALWGITSAPIVPPATPRSPRCQIPTCQLDGSLSVNGWLMCTEHYLARGKR